jgi:hypothetical protein
MSCPTCLLEVLVCADRDMSLGVDDEHRLKLIGELRQGVNVDALAELHRHGQEEQPAGGTCLPLTACHAWNRSYIAWAPSATTATVRTCRMCQLTTRAWTTPRTSSR